MPAGTGDRLDVAVSSNDASTGAFEITQDELSVTPLVPGDDASDRVSGSIDDAGGLAVYSLDVGNVSTNDGSGSSVEIVVTTPEAPSGKAREKADPGLDVEIEVIDPIGASTSTDLQAAGDGERATIDGPPGRYLVVVRDHGAGTGRFEIAANAVTYTELPFGEEVEGDVESADAPAVYAVDLPAGSDVGVSVTPTGDLDAVLEVFGPTGAGTVIDDGVEGDEERATLFGDPGRYLIAVRGYLTSTGGFEITASDVPSVALEFDEAADGEVGSAGDLASYALDVPADGDVGVTVTPSGDLDAVLEVVDPAGESTFIDHFGPGGSELADLTGAGHHLVRVSGYEGTLGSFEIVAAPLDVGELAQGDSVAATTPVAVEVEVGSGELLSFVVESDDPESLLSIRIIDPDGRDTGGSVSSDAGEPATALLEGTSAGTYKLIVGSAEPDTDFNASFEPVTAQDLREDETVSVAAPAAFDVDVIEGQTLTFTAEPESADVLLSVSVENTDGPTGTVGTSPSAGEPAQVSIGGIPGSYRLIVSSSGARPEVTATLRAAESTRLALGSAPVDGVAPTNFDIDVTAGERGLLVVTPQGGDTLTLTISSPDGEDPSVVESPGTDQPLVALLTGEGTHHVVVDTLGDGDGSFTIEADTLADGP